MSPVCECGKEMVCVKTGYCVGIKSTGMLIYGDKYKCKDCGHSIIAGFGEGFKSNNPRPDLWLK